MFDEIQSDELDGLESWQMEVEWQDSADWLDQWFEEIVDEVNAELQELVNS
jgi:hypothetical protein